VHCEDDIDKLIHHVAAADLLVGIDSGPIHVAGAVGTACVALFGPTDPKSDFLESGAGNGRVPPSGMLLLSSPASTLALDERVPARHQMHERAHRRAGV